MRVTGREIGVFALLTVIWGTTWAAIRVSLEGIPPVTGVAIRFALAGLVLVAIGRLRGVRFGRLPGEARLWWINAATTFAGSYGIVYWGEQWVPSGLAAVLFATLPLWIVILGHFLLPGERGGVAAPQRCPVRLRRGRDHLLGGLRQAGRAAGLLRGDGLPAGAARLRARQPLGEALGGRHLAVLDRRRADADDRRGDGAPGSRWSSATGRSPR